MVNLWKGINWKLVEKHPGEIKVTGNALLFILGRGYKGLKDMSLYIFIVNMNVCTCVFIFMSR